MFKIPPKELGVLRLLLDNAGEIVTKESIVNQVWCGGIVSDESLTRCLYMLRRRLGKGNEGKFIETVYGKGYCFVYPLKSKEKVNKGESSTKKKTLRIAIFPFHMRDREFSLELHDQLSELLLGLKKEGISIVPSVFTRHCEDYKSVLSLLNHTEGDYYIAGAEVVSEGKSSFRLELIDSAGHFILYREAVKMTKCILTDCELLYQAIISLLVRFHPPLKNHQLNRRFSVFHKGIFPLKLDKNLFSERKRTRVN